jgi:uncharacterized membrane protein YfcA
MSSLDVVEVLAVGVLAGTIAGMFGVGGGVLFVPALTLIVGLTQIDAEGTSLLAMIPVAVVGTVRQHRKGLIDPVKVARIGFFSGAGAVAGAMLAAQLPEDVLRKGFGVFLVLIAGQLILRARSERRERLSGDEVRPGSE